MSVYGTGLYGTALYGDTAPLSSDNLRVDMYVVGQWVNVTSKVRVEDGVSYRRGRSPEQNQASPGTAQFSLQNNDGFFSPRKTGGVFYGLRNVPARIGLGIPCEGTGDGTGTGLGLSELFSRGPVNDSQPGALNVWFGVASPPCNITVPAGMSAGTEFDGTYATFRQATVVDADGDIPNRDGSASPSATTWATINCGLSGTWTLSDSVTNTGGSSVLLAVDTAVDGQDVFVAQAWSADPTGAMVPPFFVGEAPVEWSLIADSGRSDGPRVQGWAARLPAGTWQFICVGDLGSGDMSAFCYSSSDAPRWSPRFTGVVRDWPLQWDKGGDFVTVDVEAAGGLYQGRQDALPTSAARQALARGATHYWPMEDTAGPGFTAATQGTPRLNTTVTAGTDTAPVYAQYDGFVGSQALPEFTDAGAYTGFTGWNAGTEGFCSPLLIHVPSGGAGPGANFVVYEFNGGTVNTIGFEYTSNTSGTLKVTYNDGTATYSAAVTFAGAFPTGWDGKDVLLYAYAANVGSDVYLELWLADARWSDGVTALSSMVSTTRTTKSLGSITGVRLGMEVGTGATGLVLDPAMGHLAIGKGRRIPFNLAYYASVGYAEAGFGFNGLFAAAPIPVAIGTAASAGSDSDQGPVPFGTATDRLQNVEGTEQAMLTDAAGFVGVNLWHRSLIESRAVVDTFDYTEKTLTEPLTPVDDDQAILNRVTVSRGEYGEASSEVSTGSLGVQTVGPYSQSVDALTNTAAQGEDLAEWLVNAGTVDVQRWPAVTVEWSNPANVANNNIQDLTIGRWLSLTNLPTFVGPNAGLLIVGIEESITDGMVTTTYVTQPSAVWNVLVFDQLGNDYVADAAAPTDTDSRVGY